MLEQRKAYLALFVRTVPGIVLKKTVAFSCKPMQEFHGQMNLLANEMERWKQGKFNVFIVADGKERMKEVQSILQDYEMTTTVNGKPSSEGVLSLKAICPQDSNCSSQRLAVITDAELFKVKSKRKARPQKLRMRSASKAIRKLNQGDNIVHVHHGIGSIMALLRLK